MVRPRLPHPTPAELEVLQVLWDHGPCTVREVMQHLDPRRPRGYTTVMSLLQLMVEKKLLARQPQGRAFRYTHRVERSKTLRSLLGDVLKRAFGGSSSTLVIHLLEQSSPSQHELSLIREALAAYERNQTKD